MKIILWLCLVMVMFVGGEAWAVTGAGAAALLEEGNYSMGLEAYSVNDRSIIGVNSDTETSFSSGQYFFLISYGMLDSLMLETRFGVAELELKQDPFDFNYGFVWGLSARALVFEKPQMNLKLGSGLVYLNYSPKNIEIINQTVKPEATEWQFSADVSKEFGRLTCYGGLRYSEIEIKIKDFIPEEEITAETEIVTDVKYKQENELALVFGGRYEPWENVIVAAEVQLFDGETLMLKLTYIY